MATPLILASSSPRRSELLGYLGVDFVVMTAAVEESQSGQLSPQELCQLNAYRKARAVAKDHPDSVVLGADTVVSLGAKVYGKPADMVEAMKYLRALRGKTHEVSTGVCLIHLRHHVERVFAVTTKVTFRRATSMQIENYLKCINPLDKAGAYAIQDRGEMIVEAVEGSLSNVIGLPLAAVEAELKALKVL